MLVLQQRKRQNCGIIDPRRYLFLDVRRKRSVMSVPAAKIEAIGVTLKEGCYLRIPVPIFLTAS